jgi:hypothetical protein
MQRLDQNIFDEIAFARREPHKYERENYLTIVPKFPNTMMSFTIPDWKVTLLSDRTKFYVLRWLLSKALEQGQLTNTEVIMASYLEVTNRIESILLQSLGQSSSKQRRKIIQEAYVLSRIQKPLEFPKLLDSKNPQSTPRFIVISDYFSRKANPPRKRVRNPSAVGTKARGGKLLSLVDLMDAGDGGQSIKELFLSNLALLSSDNPLRQLPQKHGSDESQ